MGEADAAARRVIFDPALPEEEQRSLRKAGACLPPGDGRPRADSIREPYTATKRIPGPEAAREEYLWQVGMAVGVAVVAFLVGRGLSWMSGLFLETFFWWTATIAYVVVAISVIWAAFWGYLWWVELLRPLKIAARRVGHYVRVCDVVGVEGRFLRRAVVAYDAVMKSAAQREGLLDHARNQVEMPQVLWDIAARSQATSRVAARHEKFEATGNAVVGEVLARRTAVLQESRAVLEQSVTTLEQYATQVDTIDQLMALRDEAERDEAEASTYTHLLASAATDTGTEAVDAIRKEAEVAASVLRDVLKGLYDTRDVPRPAE
ncbi:hypothetical protein [Streptomyces sp. P5_D11]